MFIIITTTDESNCFSKALKSKTTLREGLKRGQACQTRTGLNGFGLLNLYTLFQYNQHILFQECKILFFSNCVIYIST